MLATIATEVTLLLDWIGPEAKATAAARVPLSLPLASTTPETRATGMSRARQIGISDRQTLSMHLDLDS
eukprot:m.458314 g.458314  ORF g.458314 m.458314 type:complete len:69 (-) comp21464_c0_seq1:2090-2296(-)